MLNFDLVAAVKTLFDFAKGVGDFVETVGKLKPESSDRLCRALRLLYFYEDGILDALRRLERGENVSGADPKIFGFSDAEFEVRQALDSLDLASLREDLKLSIRQVKDLREITDLKMGLRSKLRKLVEVNPSRRIRIDQVELRHLIDAIEELNAAIEEAEQKLNRHIDKVS